MAQELKGSEILAHTGPTDQQYKVKIYDFKRPDKFSKEQIRTMSIIHETCERITKASLSTFTRQEVGMRLTLVDQCTYEEFMHSVPDPTVLGVVNMSPLRGNAVLQMNNTLFSAFADRLYGGRGKAVELDRELTDIEEHIAGDIFSKIVHAMKESWQIIIDLQPELTVVETITEFCQIVPPTEMIVLISFDVTIGNSAPEKVNLVIPYVTIEPIVGRLSPMYFYSTIKKKKKNAGSPSVNIEELANEMSIYFEGPELSIAGMNSLKVGDTLGCRSLDSGEAWIRTGGQDVLKLAFEGDLRDKNQYLAVVGGSSSIGELAGAVDKARQPGKEDAAVAINRSLDAMSEKISDALSDLKSNLKELSDRQDEMADHLYLSEGDVERSRKPYPSARPFDFIGTDDVSNLHMFIHHEHPQLCALVLSYLDPKPASLLIGMFEPEEQIELAKRIAGMDRTAPEVLERVEGGIKQKLDLYDENTQFRAGGLESITSILNLTVRGVEKNIIEGLEKSDEDLAEEIKKRMFVFEDIVLLDIKAVAKLVGRAPLNDFAMAIRGVEQVVTDYIYEACDETARKTIDDLREEIGPVRMKDVEAAQTRIVSVIRMMEQEGEIIVAGVDELVL